MTGPVDTTATVTGRAFRTWLETVAADESVDALLAIGVPTALADLTEAIRPARLTKPIAAVLLGLADTVSVADRPPAASGAAVAFPRLPVCGFPESAARALGHAARYREWRDGEHGQVPELSGLDRAAARAMIEAYLIDVPDGGWLAAADVIALLGSYRITGAQNRGAASQTAALRSGGAEVVVAVAQNPVFGPLVTLGVGGVASDGPDDHPARLVPLTGADAADLIRGVRGAPQYPGHRDPASHDTTALTDMLLRVSRLADDLPEIAEPRLNPVIASPGGVAAADVRVRVRPATPTARSCGSFGRRRQRERCRTKVHVPKSEGLCPQCMRGGEPEGRTYRRDDRHE